MMPILAFMVTAGIILVSVANEAQALPVLAGMGIVVVSRRSYRYGRGKAQPRGGSAVSVSGRRRRWIVIVVRLSLDRRDCHVVFLGALRARYAADRVTRFLPFGMIIIYGIIAFNVGPFGPPTPYDKLATGPFRRRWKWAILSTLFFGIGYYLLNEFENRRQELAKAVNLIEDRVASAPAT